MFNASSNLQMKCQPETNFSHVVHEANTQCETYRN